MNPRNPVWLLFFIYPVCISCTVLGGMEGSANYGNRPSEEETDCNITISHKSVAYLTVLFHELDPDVAHFTLLFPNHSVVNSNEAAIEPLRWIWTFSGEDRKVPFLGWNLDYAVLSFGLLNAKALPDCWVGLDVEPPNCSITIGKIKSNLEIAYAFSNMTNTYFHSVDFKYKNRYVDNRNHSWCFASEIPGVKDTFLYRLGIHFGYPVDFVRYNCCNSHYDFINEEIRVICLDQQISMIKDTTSGPFLLGFVIFCYFPILLFDFVSNMTGKKSEVNGGFKQFRHGYMSLDETTINEKVNFEDNLTSDFVYLEKHSPITLSSIICEFCFQEKRHPKLASRLKRTLFIILCPILVYIKLIVYGCTLRKTTLELINHGTPMNFVTMLGGFERSRELFAPLLGGPYVLISLFYVLGFVLVVLPENLENVLEDGSLDTVWADKYPLTLGYNSIKYFSHMQIEDECGYGRLKSLMIARFFCTLNPTFWKHMCHMSFARCRESLTYLRNRLPTILYYFVCLIIVPVLVLSFVAELSLSFLYYGVPLPWFIFTAFTGVAKLWIKRYRRRFDPTGQSFVSCCAIPIGGFLLIPILFYFLYSMTLIFCTGFNFVAKIIAFLFIAVLVYPTTAFGYLFFGTSLFYYLLKQLRGIGDAYFDLLSDIVELVIILEAEQNQLRVVDDTLVVPNRQSVTIQKIQVNGCLIKLSEKQLKEIRLSASQVNDGLIRYKDKVPGIPRGLFLYVVQKHRPVFIAVFKAFLRIGLIMMLMLEVLRISSDTSNESSQITEVMHVIFIVLIGSLPRALEITFSGSNKAVLKEIFLKQLESTILQYKNK